jgi:adenylate cyclase
MLRAVRREDKGEVLVREVTIPPDAPTSLGREPRRQGGDPDFGADVAVAGDGLVSNRHAVLTWNGVNLRVQRWHKARNPVYSYDPDDPTVARPADDFTVEPFGRFRIGNTIFLVLPDVGGDPGFTERSISGEELNTSPFADPAVQIDALVRLPDMIRHAPDEDQLVGELLDVLLIGVPRAEATAVVAWDGRNVQVRASKFRDGVRPRPLGPSRQLVTRAVQNYENVQHIWGGGGDNPDATFAAGGADWAICVRLIGPAPEAIYLLGRITTNPAEVAVGMTGDMKFAKLAGDIYSGLSEIRLLQRRDQQFTQLVSPIVRQAVAGRSLDEVVVHQQLPVTVLFCDLRGSVSAVERGGGDLLNTWDLISQALDVMAAAIISTDGVIGDFQGDAAMGFWGWPLPQEDQIDRAARAALTIRRKFAAFVARRGHPLADFVCGIGLAHGDAIAGRLGTSDQVKIGVFGPTVNRAARLESATKLLKVPILVDEAVLAHLRDGPLRAWCRTRRLAKVVPQGMSAPVLIGELLPPDGEAGPNLWEANRKMYEGALDRFLAGDWAGFRRVAGGFPPDGPMAFLARYVDDNAGPDGRPPAGWDGGVPVAK